MLTPAADGAASAPHWATTGVAPSSAKISSPSAEPSHRRRSCRDRQSAYARSGTEPHACQPSAASAKSSRCLAEPPRRLGGKRETMGARMHVPQVDHGFHPPRNSSARRVACHATAADRNPEQASSSSRPIALRATYSVRSSSPVCQVVAAQRCERSRRRASGRTSAGRRSRRARGSASAIMRRLPSMPGRGCTSTKAELGEREELELASAPRAIPLEELVGLGEQSSQSPSWNMNRSRRPREYITWCDVPTTPRELEARLDQLAAAGETLEASARRGCHRRSPCPRPADRARARARAPPASRRSRQRSPRSPRATPRIDRGERCSRSPISRASSMPCSPTRSPAPTCRPDASTRRHAAVGNPRAPDSGCLRAARTRLEHPPRGRATVCPCRQRRASEVRQREAAHDPSPAARSIGIASSYAASLSDRRPSGCSASPSFTSTAPALCPSAASRERAAVRRLGRRHVEAHRAVAREHGEAGEALLELRLASPLAGRAAELERLRRSGGRGTPRDRPPARPPCARSIGCRDVLLGPRRARDLLVGDVADERVPERELLLVAHRRDARRPDELAAHELVAAPRAHRRGHAPPIAASAPVQNTFPRTAASCSSALSSGAQRVEPRGDERLHGLRQVSRVRSTEPASLDEHARRTARRRAGCRPPARGAPPASRPAGPTARARTPTSRAVSSSVSGERRDRRRVALAAAPARLAFVELGASRAEDEQRDIRASSRAGARRSRAAPRRPSGGPRSRGRAGGARRVPRGSAARRRTPRPGRPPAASSSGTDERREPSRDPRALGLVVEERRDGLARASRAPRPVVATRGSRPRPSRSRPAPRT